MIAGAMADGSIQLWKNTGNFVRRSVVLYGGEGGREGGHNYDLSQFPQTRSNIQQYAAHTPGTETSCLCFSHNNQTLISRGGEQTFF